MALSYKVRFTNPATGAGFIDGYRTARRAKEVATKYQEQFHRDNANGIWAEYIGKDRPVISGDPDLLRKLGLRP